MLENNRIEYKRELNDRFERSVVSFLNYAGGGEIVLGIDNSGEVTGITNPDTVQLKIVDRIKNNIKPQTLGLFDVVLDKIDNNDIIRVIVSAGRQRPYYIRKFGMTEQGCFIRVGSSSQPMSEQMIEDLLAKRQQITLQTMPSPRQNLTFKQLRIYYEEKASNLQNNLLKVWIYGKAVANLITLHIYLLTKMGRPLKLQCTLEQIRWIYLKRANTATAA